MEQVDWVNLVLGNHRQIQLINDSTGPYINLDNASTTPPLRRVSSKVSDFLKLYGSVGRGAGFNSKITTAVCTEARRVIGAFVGAESPDRVTIFTKHTTEAINKVATRLSLKKGDVIIITLMEHHANLLPWRIAAARSGASVVYVDVEQETGLLRMGELFRVIDKYGPSVRMVAVSGASNITGCIPSLREISLAVHAWGAFLLVDGAQLVPHYPVNVGSMDDPGRIDFLAFSGHKIYAPYGTGVLVGPKCFFEEGIPDQVGGGAVDLVTKDQIFWKEPPFSEEAGSPNALGIVALAVACKTLSEIGLPRILSREKELATYALQKLEAISGLRIYGPTSFDSGSDRIGIMAFNVRGVHHHLVSAILAHEFGIATRSGLFCSHPYLLRLLDVEEITSRAREGAKGQKWADLPGAVRASLGIYNSHEDIDVLADALSRIVNGEYQGEYVQDKQTGVFLPASSCVDYRSFFDL